MLRRLCHRSTAGCRLPFPRIASAPGLAFWGLFLSRHGPPQLVTACHNSPQPATAHYSPPQPTTAHHSLSQLATTHHSPPWPTTACHNSPQPATTHHSPPQFTTARHNPPQPATTHHSPPQSATVRQEHLYQPEEKPRRSRHPPHDIIKNRAKGKFPWPCCKPPKDNHAI